LHFRTAEFAAQPSELGSQLEKLVLCLEDAALQVAAQPFVSSLGLGSTDAGTDDAAFRGWRLFGVPLARDEMRRMLV